MVVRRRLIALAGVGACLSVAFGVRLLTGGSGALAQYSGTALYAAMIYAGVFVLMPSLRPAVAAGSAIAFCWLIELFQLTGIPADLSEQSLLARLALGVTFDPTDLLWYAIGVLPVATIHSALLRLRRRS